MVSGSGQLLFDYRVRLKNYIVGDFNVERRGSFRVQYEIKVRRFFECGRLHPSLARRAF